MEQMGKVLQWLITIVAKTKNSHGPIVFTKWDIKDGFWHLVVSDEDAWNFCYVLPWLSEDDPFQIVKPVCLQMEWCESPPLFCMALEMARNITQVLLDQITPLPPHLLEDLCIPMELDLPKTDEINKLAKLLDVYMDNFIRLAQAPMIKELEHFTRAVMHGIHSVFPPPGIMDDPEDEPILVKNV